jgi:glutathione S-transferase
VKFKLISYLLCPYVQRAAIVLEEKGLPYDRVNIDLENKPQWFTEISPLGRVPLLIIDNESVLFESSVIAEFIDEDTGGGLLSTNTMEKARQRQWIEFASAVLTSIFRFSIAETDEAYSDSRQELDIKWQTVEDTISDGPFFSGNDFSLVDAAYAPALHNCTILESLTGEDFFRGMPKIRKWRDKLLSRDTVRNAIGEENAGQVTQSLAARNSVAGRLAKEVLASRDRTVA